MLMTAQVFWRFQIYQLNKRSEVECNNL